jgi:selenocysteine lyase/cysteine desulfurase
MDRLDARKIEQELRQTHRVHVKFRQARNIAGLRVSPHIYMLKSDLDLFVDALRRAIRHG